MPSREKYPIDRREILNAIGILKDVGGETGKSKSEEHKQHVVPNELKLTSVIGFGYDFLNYDCCDMEGVKNNIIDYSDSVGVHTWNSYENKFESALETSVYTLYEKISKKIGVKLGLGLFSASFSHEESRETTSVDEKTYACITVHERRQQQNLPAEFKWKESLNEYFKKDLNNPNVSPEELFKKYGTHVILQAHYGGQMILTGIAMKHSVDTVESMSTSLAAAVSLAKTGQSNGTVMTREAFVNRCISEGYHPSTELIDLMFPKNNNQDQKKLEYEQTTCFVNREGFAASSLMLKGHGTGGILKYPGELGKLAEVTNAWIDSITNENMSFIGVYGGEDGCAPIWELADKTSRRNEIYQYFKAQKEAKENAMKEAIQYITDFKLIFAGKREDAIVKANRLRSRKGERWVVLDRYNLNQDVVRGGYLYLCYRKETEAEMKTSGNKPITNLFLYCDDKEHKGFQYKRFQEWKDATVKDAKKNLILEGVRIGTNFDFVGDVWPKSIETQNMKHAALDAAPFENEAYEVSNLNHGPFLWQGRFILLCYTRDTRFAPLTSLCAYYNKEEFNMIHRVLDWIDVPQLGRSKETRCCTSAGHSSRKDIYLAFRRTVD